MFIAASLSLLSLVFSNYASEEYLELFPGKEKERVVLPFPYYSPTPEERKLMKVVGEGCFTVLNNPGEIAYLGPLQPCQLVAISNKKKAIAAHKVHNADFPLLLKENVKEEFGNVDPSDISAICFTNNMKEGYEAMHRGFYKGKSQKDVLIDIKNDIIQEFGIKSRDQVKARFFASDKPDFALGNYEFAETSVLVRMGPSKEIIVNSVCPMAENLFSDLRSLPLQQRIQMTVNVLNFSLAQKNSFNTKKVWPNVEKNGLHTVYPFERV